MLSSMLDTDKSDSQILDGLRRAGEERSISKIARELGIPRQALYDYSSKGYLGRESRKKLAQWLSTNRYMETSKPVPRKDPLSHAVAQELRGLADMLDSHVLEPGVFEEVASHLHHQLGLGLADAPRLECLSHFGEVEEAPLQRHQPSHRARRQAETLDRVVAQAGEVEEHGSGEAERDCHRLSHLVA